METLFQDLRYGVRMLAKRPGFAFVAIITLALGIGANSAIFSVINAVILKPLPFPEPSRLMSVYETHTQRGSLRNAVAYPNFADWRDQNHVFERIAAYHNSNYILTGAGDAARLQGEVVSADIFELLGAAAALGRTFLTEEDKPGPNGRVVVLSHRLWQTRFNADPSVLEKPLTLNGSAYTVVGVMPAGFQFPINNEPADLWTTFAVESDTSDGTPITNQRGAHYLNVIARLKPDVTRGQAQAEMDAIMAGLAAQYPNEDTYRGANVMPALEALVGDIRPMLLILLGAVAFVLLIACANVANILLARATSRQKEMAIRAALGASRARVIRQLLTESLLLALAGGAIGLLVALWGTDILVAISRDDIPRAAQIGLDGRVLLFTLAVSVLTGLVFGLVPAVQSSRSDLSESLKEGGRGSSEGGRRNRIRSALVIVEVAAAVVLLAGAGLLIESLRRLQNVSPGFNPKNVLAFNVGLPDVKYDARQQVAFYKELAERVGRLPGVAKVSAVSPLPLSQERVRITFEIEGRPVPQSDLPASEYRGVLPDYFSVMGIPLVSGREFTERDDVKAPPVIIVNQAFAQKFFPGENPIGKRIEPGISVDEGQSGMREIIGVVGNVKHIKLSNEDDPEYYVPHAQMPFDSLTIVARTRNDPRGLALAVQDEVKAIDKDLPVYDVKTLEDYVASSVSQPRFNTLLLSVFAGLALALTAIGLYGVMSYAVAQRTHEIGIRMALGAQGGDVLRLVVGQGMMLTLIGMAAGLGAAFLLTRLMESWLFGVSAKDPATFAAVAAVIAIVALAACYVPARRATRVDPMIALRYE